MKHIKILFIAILPVLLVLSGCMLEEPDVKRTETQLNGQTLSRYVSLGNSLTAGVQSGGLVEDFQMYSLPSLIAGQLGIDDFAQPTVSFPGIPAILQLNPITEGLETAPGTGVPNNLAYPAPYNNLGVPTATTWDILNAINATTCFRYTFFGERNDAFDLILRNPDFGNTTMFQQAMLQQPELLTLWIGGNDALGYATSGGVKPLTPPVDDIVSPVTGLPVQSFQNSFTELMDSVSVMVTTFGTQVAVANVPDVTAIPFFKVVGPGIAASFIENNINFPLAYEKGTDDLATGIATGSATTANLLNFDVMVTLVGSGYTGEIGAPSGKWYRDLAAMQSVPVSALLTTMPFVDTTQAFGLHPQNPWPNALILDPEEIATVQAVTDAYNQVIAANVTARGFAWFDAYEFLNDVNENGYASQGYQFTSDFISGGMFSLDGIHLSSAGNAVAANQFIAAINENYDVDIAPVLIREVLGNAPVKKVSKSQVKYRLQDLAGTIEMVGGRFW